MKITFKDVQQGDSIIIEWVDASGEEKIGIIDCNLKGTSNPVLEYLKTTSYTKIAFMILSHPHGDHFSGFLELLNYVEEKNIVVGRFAHTIGFDGAETYWKYFEWNTDIEEELQKLKQKWFALKKNKIITRLDHLTDGKVMKFDSTTNVSCLAPAHDDFQKYQEKVKLNAALNVAEARNAANLLSTVLKLEINGYHFLFTSDAEKSALRGAYERDKDHFEGVKFHICQMAHHGSKVNHPAEFWDQITNFDIQNAVASAGMGYKHPSKEVLKDFYKRGYKVYCTNIVGGMKDFVAELEEAKSALDDFSELAEEYRVANDRIFVLENDVIKLL